MIYYKKIENMTFKTIAWNPKGVTLHKLQAKADENLPKVFGYTAFKWFALLTLNNA